MDKRTSQWDKKQLVPNFAVSAVTQLFASFISFLISYYILKKYNPTILGELVLLISTAQVFVFLTNWSLVSIQKLGTEEYLESHNISLVFSNRFLLFLLNFLFVSGIFLVLFPVLKTFFPLTFGNGLLAIGYGFILSLNIHFYGGFQARKLLKMQGLLMLTEKLLIVAGLLLFVRYSTISLEKIAGVFILAGVTVSGICYAYSRQSLTLRWNRAMIRKIIRFSLPLFPYTVVAFFTSNYIDSFFINKYLVKGDIAIYSMAYQFNGVWIQIPTILGAIILPFFITVNKQESDKVTLQYISTYGTTLNYIWSALSYIVMIVLIGILPAVYDGFGTAFFICLFMFLVSSSVSFSAAVLFSPYLLSRGIVKIALPLALLSAVTNIAGNMLLIPAYGIAGCAMASVLFGFLYSLVLTLFISLRFGVQLYRILLNNFIIGVSVILAFLGFDPMLVSLAFLGIYLLILFFRIDDVRQVARILLGYFRRNEVVNPA